MQSPMSCGTDGDYAASEYALPTLPGDPMEVHVLGVHRGSFPPGEEHTRQTPAMKAVRVVVYKTRLPALLVFTAGEDTLWDVTLTQEARVERVVLQGRGEQKIRGIPDSIPVIHRKYAEACAYAYGWEKIHNRLGGDYRLMIQGLRCATGLRETSFQGCYSGAVFEIPHRKTETAAAGTVWSPPCPLPTEPELVASPGRAGGPGPRGSGRTSGAVLEPDAAQRAPPDAEVKRPFGGEEEGLPRPEGAPPRTGRPVEAEAVTGPVPERGGPSGGVKPRKELGKGSLGRPAGVAGRGHISVRARAILLEGRHELATHDAVPDLIEALEKGESLLRWRAADELGKMGAGAERAITPLTLALKDVEADVRSSAALALGNIGARSDVTVRRLKKLLDDESADVRYSARMALERIGTPRALKALRNRI